MYYNKILGGIVGDIIGSTREWHNVKTEDFELLPEVFTMTELQNLYEAILELKFDRRNFYNKMLKLGILSDAEPRPANASRRTPCKYRFNAEKYAELKQKGFRLEF